MKTALQMSWLNCTVKDFHKAKKTPNPNKYGVLAQKDASL